MPNTDRVFTSFRNRYLSLPPINSIVLSHCVRRFVSRAFYCYFFVLTSYTIYDVFITYTIQYISSFWLKLNYNINYSVLDFLSFFTFLGPYLYHYPILDVDTSFERYLNIILPHTQSSWTSKNCIFSNFSRKRL